MLVGVERAEGVFFYTPEGKRYFDLVSGVSVSNVGHANPAVIEAVKRQAERYMHVMVYGEMIERPQVEYAVEIAEALPDPLESVYFLNSGAEAVEGAYRGGVAVLGDGQEGVLHRGSVGVDKKGGHKIPLADAADHLGKGVVEGLGVAVGQVGDLPCHKRR